MGEIFVMIKGEEEPKKIENLTELLIAAALPSNNNEAL